MALRLIPPASAAFATQTAAGQSTPILVQTRRHCTLIATGMAGPDAAEIQISPDNGQTWQQSQFANLDTNNTTRLLNAVGLYRVNKLTTTGSVAIFVATEEEF